MATFAEFMSASLVTLQRAEHGQFMAELAQEDGPVSPCDCGVLALCRRHAQQVYPGKGESR